MAALLQNPLTHSFPPYLIVPRSHELGIDRQENFRAGAIMIFCGEAEGGETFTCGSALLSSLSKTCCHHHWHMGTTDVDLDHRHGELSAHYSVGDVHYC